MNELTNNKPTNCNLEIIVLSYNTKDITDECLSRLKKSKDFCEKKLGNELPHSKLMGYPSESSSVNQNKISVIVVDNASSDGSVEMIQKKHPWVRLIISKTNTGFSGGNNLAMKETKSPFVLLLNSDAYVEEETLYKSLEFLSDHPEVDILGPRLTFADHRFQPSAGFLPTPLNTIFWISGLSIFSFLNVFAPPIHPRDPNFFSKTRKVEWVMGAYFLLRRRVYDKTGGFDESIFMYGEEVEWCKRIKDHGFTIYYVPEFSIIHLDKASSKGEILKPLVNEVKGIKRYFHQHYRSIWWLIRIFMYFFLLLRVFAFSLIGKTQKRDAYIESLKVV